MRADAAQKRKGSADRGNRGSVTAGKNLDRFISMIAEIIADNGVDPASIYLTGRRDVTIPGFYRPTKNWDLLVVHDRCLLAAIELKSQVGPSFGNNFNNRVEEALGNATDLLTAFREGAFGENPKPFLGYFFVMEDCRESNEPVRCTSPHFPVMPEFDQASYVQRYDMLCRKLVQEQLYDAAALVLTSKGAIRTGAYRTAGKLTSPRQFARTLAGKIAGMVAR